MSKNCCEKNYFSQLYFKLFIQKKELTMYPLLKNCLVRGTQKEDYFLQQFLTGDNFALEELHAKILWQCNGSNSIKGLSVKFKQKENDIYIFLNILKDNNLITFLSKPKKNIFPNLSNIPFIQEIQIEGTGNCNLWCKHCYGRKSFEIAAKNDLSYSELCNVFDQMFDLNIGRCFLSGGEIFLRKDLPKLIKYIASKKIHIGGIFTNGTIYRQDVINTLRKTSMNVTFLISLDSCILEEHDYIRGNGSFNKTITCIQKIINEGFRVTINTVAMKHTVSSLFSMRKFLEELGVSRWRISVLREQGEFIVNRDLIEPKWSDVFNVYRKLLLDVLNDPREMKIQLSSIFKTEFLEKGKYYLHNENSSTCEYKRNSLVVTPNGNIIPCPAGIDVIFGNVRYDKIRDVWCNKSNQSFKNIPISETDCKDCSLWVYCGSGCRVIANQIHESYLAKDDNACFLYEFFYNVIKPIFEKNGIFPEKLKRISNNKFNFELIKQFN